MSQPVANGPALSQTAFIGAWTLASFVPWIAATLLWRVSYDLPIADGAAAILFGANAGEAGAERAHRILYSAAFFFGIVLAVLIEARLLRQFHDDTRWWWILGIAAALAMELVYAAAPAVTGAPLVAAEAIGLRMLGYLLWVAAVWRLIRYWQWHDRYWLAFNIVVALALPLVDRFAEEAPHWARVLYAHIGVTDPVGRHVLGDLSTGLISTIIVAAPMAWFLWRYVVVHRRDMAPPAS